MSNYEYLWYEGKTYKADKDDDHYHIRVNGEDIVIRDNEIEPTDEKNFGFATYSRKKQLRRIEENKSGFWNYVHDLFNDSVKYNNMVSGYGRKKQ